MGAGFSDLVGYNWSRRRDPPVRPGLGDMPESCVSSILMHLDPPEICKLARLNRTFYGASSADYLWETKLPQNYEFLVSKVLGGRAMSKKEIYARLCRPNRFDDGTKDVWLDKSSGKVWLSVSAKAMKITGIDDRRYWNYIPTEESRFHMVAYLQQIWWLEVVGEIEVQLPPGSYTLYFRLHLGKPFRRFGRTACNLDHVHGWDMKPVRFQLFTSDGQHCSSERHLDLPGKWVYYDVGDFVISNNNNSSTNVSSPTKIKFSMMQIDCTHIKGGLCVDSTLICPSDSRERLIGPV